MIEARAMELVTALRSGKYKQVNGLLKRLTSGGKIGFCCLGVACDISGVGKWVEDDRHVYVVNDQHVDTALPNAVMDYFGFRTTVGSFEDFRPVNYSGRELYSLIAMNDAGMSFLEIADYIEKNWENL